MDTELQKDGPSAGLALALAGLSAYTGRPLRPPARRHRRADAPRGRARGGRLHEKLVAAYLADQAMVIAPRRNLFELRTLPAEVVARLEIVYADSLAEAVELARGKDPGG